MIHNQLLQVQYNGSREQLPRSAAYHVRRACRLKKDMRREQAERGGERRREGFRNQVQQASAWNTEDAIRGVQGSVQHANAHANVSRTTAEDDECIAAKYPPRRQQLCKRPFAYFRWPWP